MRVTNSNDCILIEVYKRLLVDIIELSGVSLDAPDDISYDWVLIEGPKLDKQLLNYIEHNGLMPSFPEWIQPLWNRFLISNEAPILMYLRQLLLFCYKAEFEPTNEQLKEAQAQFEETDASIEVWDAYFKSRPPCFTHATARHTIITLLRETVNRNKFKDITPSHGPGAVFPHQYPWEKSKFLTLYPSIQEYYPYDQFFCGLPSFWKEVMVDEISGELQECQDIVANLVAVPKDSRGPRLICVHPSEAIWIQQGQRLVLEAAISMSNLTRGKINFTDQTVNGSLALSSSATREYVTLDLKEASDRLSTTLVRYLLGETLFGLLSCSRANKVKLLDGRVIELRKWAPMGNCLTFPIQSLIFWAIVRSSILCRYGENCNDVYVFGDDIIYPTKYHEGVLQAIICSGLIPNSGKTFAKGFFRESCGVDAYRGIDITPLRARACNVNATQGAIAYLDLCKRLRTRGYRFCTAYIYARISEVFGRLPLCNNPDAVGFFEYVQRDGLALIATEATTRYKRGHQKFGVRCLVVKGCLMTSFKHDWYHVQDSLIRLAHMHQEYSDRGTEYPIPYRTQLCYGWADILLN